MTLSRRMFLGGAAAIGVLLAAGCRDATTGGDDHSFWLPILRP